MSTAARELEELVNFYQQFRKYEILNICIRICFTEKDQRSRTVKKRRGAKDCR
jgi:hypothetical protein